MDGIATRYRVAAPAAPLDAGPGKEWRCRTIAPLRSGLQQTTPGNLPARAAACRPVQRAHDLSSSRNGQGTSPNNPEMCLDAAKSNGRPSVQLQMDGHPSESSCRPERCASCVPSTST
ncbi:hypothetical protein DGM98_15830 [Xanthomonas citri]|uniref:Xanthomonadin biosynthesis protein n=1 Tax=Xanthomonas citri pv. phaseoli var. fuscans TaxID=473423 RepID=A0AB33FBT1_XANCI|nr:hypothetical protein DGM98_15830 [Xanthomonas citri]